MSVRRSKKASRKRLATGPVMVVSDQRRRLREEPPMKALVNGGVTDGPGRV